MLSGFERLVSQIRLSGLEHASAAGKCSGRTLLLSIMCAEKSAGLLICQRRSAFFESGLAGILIRYKRVTRLQDPDSERAKAEGRQVEAAWPRMKPCLLVLANGRGRSPRQHGNTRMGFDALKLPSSTATRRVPRVRGALKCTCGTVWRS